MAKQARFFLDPHTRVGHETGAALMGRLCSNSLTCYGAGGAEVGAALSASVAMFNHDCDPNADWSIDEDGCLVVRALRRVDAGQELFLSYVDPRLPAAARIRKLRENFFFECGCRACSAGIVAPRWTEPTPKAGRALGAAPAAARKAASKRKRANK